MFHGTKSKKKSKILSQKLTSLSVRNKNDSTKTYNNIHKNILIMIHYGNLHAFIYLNAFERHFLSNNRVNSEIDNIVKEGSN